MSYFLAKQGDEPEECLILDQPHLEARPRATEVDQRAPVWIAPQIGLLLYQVQMLENPLPCQHASRAASWTIVGRIVAPVLSKYSRHAVHRGGMERIAVIRIQLPEGSITKPHRLFQHCAEHGCEVARRRIDDAQNLGCRRLLLQSFTCFVNEAGVLDSEERLGGEV